jgi:hypothetical protein
MSNARYLVTNCATMKMKAISYNYFELVYLFLLFHPDVRCEENLGGTWVKHYVLRVKTYQTNDKRDVVRMRVCAVLYIRTYIPATTLKANIGSLQSCFSGHHVKCFFSVEERWLHKLAYLRHIVQ